MVPRPLVTIVTPCLNRVATIDAAVQSVCDQDYAGPIEHLVIDGGSSDGTLEVLAKYSSLTVVSEADDNLYDAINKGISRATGDIVGLLNSDDTYRSDAIRKAVATLEAEPRASLACGGAVAVDDRGRTLLHYDAATNRSLDPDDLLFGVPVINARFFRRAIFDRVGAFDTRYSIVADREFLLRAALAGEVAASIRGVVYEYGSHAGSLTIGGAGSRQLIAEETMQMIEDWLGRTPQPPSSVISSLRRLHAQCVLVGAAASLRDLDFPAFQSYLGRGQRTNAWWPLDAAGAVGAWMVRRLRLQQG